MGTQDPGNEEVTPLLTYLLRAHEDGLALSHRLLMAQGVADEAESEAARAFDRAAARPRDIELADQAVSAARASELAGEREMRAAVEWCWHRARIRGLIQEAQAALSSIPMASGRYEAANWAKNWGCHPSA
jgi:hypothetical protein